MEKPIGTCKKEECYRYKFMAGSLFCAQPKSDKSYAFAFPLPGFQAPEARHLSKARAGRATTAVKLQTYLPTKSEHLF